MRSRLGLYALVVIALTFVSSGHLPAQHHRIVPAAAWIPDSVPARAAATVVAVPASGLTVVTVPLPPSFTDADDVGYTITPLVPGAVLGQLIGRVAPDVSRRSIVFAVRTPRHALAGPTTIAIVEWRGATRREDASVIADVAAVRGASVAVAASLVAPLGNEPLRLPYRLTSTGNAPDTLALEVVAPAGWRVRDVPAPIPVAARESVDDFITLIPPPAVTGGGIVRLLALSRGAVVAQAAVEVQLPSAHADAAPRPVLRTTVAAAVGPWDGVSTVNTVEIDGPLSDGLSIRARGSTSAGADAANYALSRAGAGRTPFALHLAAPAWSLDAGTLGTSLTGLSGVNVVGRGAAVQVQQPRWSGAGFILDPDVVGSDVQGSLTAARVEYSPGAFSLMAATSRLRESRDQVSRSLDALSMGGALSAGGGRLGAEVARRRYAGVTASGWSATFARRTPSESFDVRYSHAPGGSSAFARASNELSISARRRVGTSLDVTGGVWHSADGAGPTRTGLTIDGWNAGAQFDLARDAYLLMTARSASFGASTSLGDFSSGERALEASLNLRRSPLMAEVTAGIARLERRTLTHESAALDVARAAQRASVRAELAFGGRDGSAGVTGQFDRTGAGVGASPQQWSLGTRMDTRIRLSPSHAVRLDAAIERVGGPLGASRSTALRAGAETEAGPTTIRLGAERNPFVVPASSGGPWMYMVTISRALAMPRVGQGGTRGVVYRDLNGNGRRDRGEAGFSGILLRRDGDLAVTNRDGEFLLAGDVTAPYEVDARSLPLGWIVPSTVIAAATRTIGAIGLAPLEIEFAVDSVDQGRVATTDLSAVLVILRDSLGRTWAARPVSDTRRAFDAVPPGTYEVIVDGSRSREPLRPAGELRVVVGTAIVNRSPIRIVLRARPLRFSQYERQESP